MTTTDGSISGTGTTGPDGSESGTGLGVTGAGSGSEHGSRSQAMLADGSWLAGLAMGDSTRIYYSNSALISLAFFTLSIICL